MALVDLDAKRAARREASGESLTVRLGGVDYDLPVEMPIAVAEVLAPLAARESEEPTYDDVVLMRTAMVVMFGQEGWDRFAADASLEDLMELLESVFAHYGVSLGEQQGSEPSSSNTGDASNPTSNGSTGSTPDSSSTVPALLG